MLTQLLTFLLVRLQMAREEGQDLAEYALLIALIAVVVIAGVVLLGNRILAVFQNIAGSF
jgi:Flp pilus assembly pilin Flp